MSIDTLSRRSGTRYAVVAVIGLAALLTSTFGLAWPRQTKGFILHLPLTSEDCGDAPRHIVIKVLADGSKELNGVQMTSEALGRALARTKRRRAEFLMFVTADPDASVDSVASAIDEASEHADAIILATSMTEALQSCPTVRNPPIPSWPK